MLSIGIAASARPAMRLLGAMDSDCRYQFDHAWRYFALHAQQRMTLFNFFLVLTGLLSAGLSAAIRGSETLALLGATLGLLLMAVSYTFWKLDQRVCFLMKRAEDAMGNLESLAFPSGSW